MHILASEIGLPAVLIKEIYSNPSNERITIVKHGGSFLHLDHQFDPWLSSLPDVTCVRSRDSRLELETLGVSPPRSLKIGPQRESHWWRASLDYLISETMTPEAGHNAMLARLIEAMFVQVLRWQLRYACSNYGGWPAGLYDRRALTLIHYSPERSWTVDELARAAGMSRFALARRFVDLVGQSPVQYLAGWRMHLERSLLTDSTLAIGEIGGRIRYDFEAASSRAFRRIVGTPPAVWRQANPRSGDQHVD